MPVLPTPLGPASPLSSRRILTLHPSRFPSSELPWLSSCAAASFSPCQELKRSYGPRRRTPLADRVSLPTVGAARPSPPFSSLPGKREGWRQGRDFAWFWRSATASERGQWRRGGCCGRSGRSNRQVCVSERGWGDWTHAVGSLAGDRLCRNARNAPGAESTQAAPALASSRPSFHHPARGHRSIFRAGEPLRSLLLSMLQRGRQRESAAVLMGFS